jgi:hypothetical protein
LNPEKKGREKSIKICRRLVPTRDCDTIHKFDICFSPAASTARRSKREYELSMYGRGRRRRKQRSCGEKTKTRKNFLFHFAEGSELREILSL